MVTACYSTGQILLVLLVLLMISVLIGTLIFLGMACRDEQRELRSDLPEVER
jgi:hypothetical protein